MRAIPGWDETLAHDAEMATWQRQNALLPGGRFFLLGLAAIAAGVFLSLFL
jgi:hypothetical protein